MEIADQPVDQWDFVLIHVIKEKLSTKLCEKWEEFTGISKIPTMKEFTACLERRVQIEITRSSQAQYNVNKGQKVQERPASGHGSHPPRAFSATIPSNAQNTRTHKLCPMCQGEHAIYTCKNFLKLAPQKQFTEVKNASLCVNCLRCSHRPIDCRLMGCRQCHKRHNSLLHFEQKENQVKSTADPVASTSTYHLRIPSEVYLATSIVDIRDGQGNYQPCRIILEGGAQPCTITNKCVSRLGLHKTSFEIPLLSLSHMQTNIKFATSATFESRFDNKKRNLDLLVVNQIADAMPSMPLDRNAFELPANIFLADPKFHEPAPVDIIIGAEFAYTFLRTGQLRMKGHAAVLQKTVLGWITAGRVYNQNRKTHNRSANIFFLFNQGEKLLILWELDPV
ncbi:uncharacterized protein LOC117181308 [Belonocnema kinseyi]|uniref:uncharacterized protein LOC117181308 n=1 Tax=Belonocnema kinseyi TaxID=2817044 RepID=UPI00143DA840|nr:uncharacterized protein LOC117181308 [Belonocnema kinseyi]